MAAVSSVWFVILKFAVMPHFWQTWFASIYKDLQAPGKSGYGSVVQTILINPTYFLTTMLREEKLIYFLHMFGPLALLPTRRWALLMLAIPGFAFSMLTTGYAPTISIAFQYTCHSIPYVFAATVLMVRLVGERPNGAVRRQAVLTAVAFGVLCHSYVFGAILQHQTFVGGFSKVEFTMSDEEVARYKTMKEMRALIPQNASVAASENEVPHVSARMDAYTIKDGAAPDADFILVNQNQMGGGTRTAVNTMFSHNDYGLLKAGHGLYLFKRGYESAETKAAISTLGIGASKRSKRNH
jgi:uncharacterized membrane protein